jgi:hypothetical protein
MTQWPELGERIRHAREVLEALELLEQLLVILEVQTRPGAKGPVEALRWMALELQAKELTS